MMFLDLWADILNLIPSIFRIIGVFICNIIYGLISMLFKLFMVVSQLNILSSNEIGPIYERVTLILTIVMVFYITFEFVKYIVQPDVMTDKEKGAGNIVLRMIVAIVLIAFVPRIFTIAYDVQNRLISSQVFSKIILGEKNMDFDTYGSAFAADMLGVFYGLNETVCNESNYDNECQIRDARVQENLRQLREEGSVTLLPRITDSKIVTIDGEDQVEYYIKFDGIMAIIVGGVILYIIVLYTIDVGVRYAQMLFLQIISPIAILGYIAPKKDGMFQKWLKQCITTYLDLFIRLSIIYFILLIVRLLGDAFNSDSLFAGIEGVGGGYKTLTYIVLIIGLFVFAQKAPKMLGELLPGGGAASIGFGLKGADRFAPAFGGIKKGLSRTFNFGKRTAGGVAGGVAGAYKALKNVNKRKGWSATKAMFKGIKAGAGKGGGIRKGLDAASNSVQKDLDIIEKGGDPWISDIHGTKVTENKTVYERETARYKSVKTENETVTNSVKELKGRKFVDGLKETDAAKGNAELLDRLTGDVKAVEKAYKVYAVAKGSGDKRKEDAAYATLETAMKSSMIGTGYYQGDKNNSLILSTLKDGNGNLIDVNNAIRLGTLDKSKIDQLENTTMLTESLKEIMKKSRGNRTAAEQKMIEDFLSMHNQNVSEINEFVKGKIEPESDKLITVKTNIKNTMAACAAISTATININGVPTEIGKLDAETFAKELGTIDDMAERVIRERETTQEYKELQANAQGSSGKQ